MKQIQTFKKDKSGSFTIEASIIFPTLLILTLCLIFFSLVIYQKAMMHYSATTIAERIAYTWDNSKKDWVTGEFKASDYTTYDPGDDGLYWRFTGNDFLEQFGISLEIGDGGVKAKKIDPARIGTVPFGDRPSITYENGLTGNFVKVRLISPLNIPSFTKDLFGIDQLDVTAKRRVNEPVEFMRNVDFAVYAVNQIKNTPNFRSLFSNFRNQSSR